MVSQKLMTIKTHIANRKPPPILEYQGLATKTNDVT